MASSSSTSLYLVFTLADGDILNCRLATYDRQIAEYECCLAMRTTPDRWTRIVEKKQCTIPAGLPVWIGVVDGRSFMEFNVEVYDQACSVPENTDWVEDLVIV
jgi:hypothetical protein